ncbi:hypothetical protein MJT46_009680 [Ovis ammon polii x Ovis aries]|nr:hypothetical protein MJT46_009680 [Ovis ammon polii x Ovis aries]
MRKNLDPYNEYLEEELWNVLEEVQLKEAIKALPSGLNTELAESGFSLSIGQRQLVCLARVVLRKNQILILDKATSNVDPSLPFLSSLKYINFCDFRTDELIHKKIREKFAQCTVLTITHKLSTVIDCERILVLDSGNKVEYDEPYELLQDGDSLLYNMVQQLGEAEATVLTERAKQLPPPHHTPSNFQKKVDCHQDKSGIHNTLTLYSGWCLNMRFVKAISTVHGVKKVYSEIE